MTAAVSPAAPSGKSRFSDLQAVPELFARCAQQPAIAQRVAVHDPHSTPEVKLTYAELYQQIMQFAAGLQALGIQEGDRIALFSDNRPRWLVADQGIMTAGAIDAVRGSQADPGELRFILDNSEAVALITEDAATLKKVSPNLDDLPLQTVILLTDETLEAPGLKILNFSQVLELGTDRAVQPPAQRTRDTLATLMYTSGTSGVPKGVMLSHGNLLSQVEGASTVVEPQPGDRVLSILPIWHCYERTFEYFIFAHGCTQIYTNIRFVKKDLKEFRPQFMVGVPRLWESIYEGIQKQFRDQPENKQKLVSFLLAQSDRYVKANRTLQGLNLDNLNPSVFDKLKAMSEVALTSPAFLLADRLVFQKVRDGIGGSIKFVVSGGGSIAEHLEDFFEMAGIPILGGYGLTETSPITHVRRVNHNMRGADGQALPYTETRIVNPETRQDLPQGQQGLILIRGRQVMQGYYKNPEATRKAIDPEGWFDTGDLGWMTQWGDLIITGRAKDTIVLTNGENIEPQPIENAIIRSLYIDQVMLVGQDQRMIGALVVPNLETLESWAASQGDAVRNADGTLNLESKPVQDLIRKELAEAVQNRPGFRPDERVGPFRILSDPFTVDNGLLTQTLKVRRNVVMERYGSMIESMFA
ncbi:MAG: long-chain fatty acid--CoA ligase [Cyanobacteria bacterium J069]|nr:MAG: long-chain fatty acid--CoA ligase [Cyanobacteria bacterium J069]